MKHYEAMFILHNRDLGESEEGEAPPGPEEVVRQLVEKVGGTVHHLLPWANRKLAYAIKGNQTGTYILAYISGESKMSDELNREVHLSERVLRHMLIKVSTVPEEADLPGPLTEPVGRSGRRGEIELEGEKRKLWEMLDYKNVHVLRRMVTSQGKLFSRQRSNLEAKNQRRLRREVFRARNLALLPFVSR